MRKVDHKALKLILNGCVKRQAKWQRALYDLLFDSVAITISKFSLSKQETEDLIQETFIKIFNNLDKYDSKKSSIKTWASIIAKRIVINHINSCKYYKNMVDSLVELEHHQTNVGNETLEFNTEKLNRALNQIPNKYKLVLELSIYQGLKHKAISNKLGISESTSRVYLTRAIELVRKYFKN